jgi:anti-anti-sigma regulatory factor
MAIQDLSDHALLITLPRETQHSAELEIITRLIARDVNRDIVVDFSLVQMMPSATICRLLNAAGRRLVLCSVPSNIAGIFSRVGLNNVFWFAHDQWAALRRLENCVCSAS